MQNATALGRRAWPSDAIELSQVLEIADDVWTERVGPGPVDVRLSPRSLAALDATGIDYGVRITDVQLVVDEEHDRLTAAAVVGMPSMMMPRVALGPV